MALNYNGGTTVSPSSVDKGGPNNAQLQSYYHLRKSLIEARKEQFFTQLADVTKMPKHFGKKIKVLDYVPILDNANDNDQGLDPSGAVIDNGKYTVCLSKLAYTFTGGSANANATAAANAANAWAGTTVATAAAAVVTYTSTVLGPRPAAPTAFLAAQPGARAVKGSGNLYGSSKDSGYIHGKVPALSESGGRVNRVGMTRLVRTGELAKFGIFTEFSQEALDFDSDSELMSHLSRELMNAAVQTYEAQLQYDLLNAANTVVFPGASVSVNTLSPDIGSVDILSYKSLMRLDRLLTDARTPKQTTIITGSRLVDTKVVPNARIAYVGPDVVPLLRELKDSFNNPAFIEVQHYADAGNVLTGEIGTACGFRFIQVPEMHKKAGAGGAVGALASQYQNDGAFYDAFPVLVVGDQSFTTIGFNTDGNSGKFTVKTVMPSDNHSATDPYGETGFSSIKWYYGTVILRPERIGLAWTVAPI